MWVVVLPDNERIGAHLPHRGPTGPRPQPHAERLPELADVALGLPLRLEHRHRPAWAPARLGRAGHRLHEHRQRVFENRDRLAGLHRGHEVRHLLGAERRGLHGEEHVVFLGDRRRRIDLHNVVLLLELLHDRLPRPLLAAHHVEAAEEIRVGREHSEPLSLLLGSGADRANQLVFHRRALVEERHDDLLEATRERTAEKDLFVAIRAAHPREYRDGLDPELLAGERRRLRLGLGRNHFHVHLAPAEPLELPQHVDEVDPRLGVVLRHRRADVGLDVDRAVGLEPGEQPARVGGEGADSLLGEIGPQIERAKEEHGADGREHEAGRPGRVVEADLRPVAAAGPVPATDEHHRDVEAHRHDAEEVGDRREPHHTAAEVGELLRQAPAAKPLGQLRPHHGAGLIGHHERRVEREAEDEGHREVAREEARHHADREHRQAHEPVAEIIREKQAAVGRAPAEENDQITDARKQERHGEDADGGQILAKHHLPVARGNREQEFVGALPPLVGPHAHRDRRHEHEEDEGQVAVELVEVREVRIEELGRPERSERPEQHEHADEDVARGVREIGDEVPLEDRVEHVPFHDCKAPRSIVVVRVSRGRHRRLRARPWLPQGFRRLTPSG